MPKVFVSIARDVPEGQEPVGPARRGRNEHAGVEAGIVSCQQCAVHAADVVADQPDSAGYHVRPGREEVDGGRHTTELRAASA